MTQLKGGFTIENLSKHFTKSRDITQSYVKYLANSLAYFNIASYTGFENSKNNQKLKIPFFDNYINILERGAPTLISKYALDRILNDATIVKLNNNDYEINLKYNIDANLFNKTVINSLIPIESRPTKFEEYRKSWESLGSEYEEDFYYKILPNALKNISKKDADFSKFAIQLFSTQQSIDSIINESIKNDQKNTHLLDSFKEQKTDFSFEYLIYNSQNNKIEKSGIVIEIDGSQHLLPEQQYLDSQRDAIVAKAGWSPTLRITTEAIRNNTFSTNLYNYIKNCISGNTNFELLLSNYINPVWTKDKVTREIHDVIIIPYAIARIQRVLLECITNQRLLLNAKEWRIAIIERDVPCANIAIDDFKHFINNWNNILKDKIKIPDIILDVYTNDEFLASQFNKNTKTLKNFNKEDKFDLIIDIGILERVDLPYIDFTNATEIVSIRSIKYVDYVPAVHTNEHNLYNELCYLDNDNNWVEYEEKSNSINYFLQCFFRKYKLRPGQLPIINRALQQKSVIGLLPTGGGKSITYQLSSLLQPGITLVVAPIKSLMKDQVDGLNNNLIDSCLYINSSLSTLDKKIATKKMQNGEVLFVFISPERLQMLDFRRGLERMYEDQLYFNYCVIDEAHCVSEWGHDFRPAYLRLGHNAMKFCKTKSLPALPLFGLTATASYDVLADVQRELSGYEVEERLGEESVIRAPFTKRPELQYLVRKINNGNTIFNDGRHAAQTIGPLKRENTLMLINELPTKIETINNTLLNNDTDNITIDNFNPNNFFNDNGQSAGLIFCPHRSWEYGVNTYTDMLSNQPGLRVGSFMGGNSDNEGGMSDEIYLNNQTKFINNELNLMVATKAFGMGIDKPNVRFTIHINYPNSIESYVQEAGRAGRDRKLALSYILLSDVLDEDGSYDPEFDTNMYFHKNSFKGIQKEIAVVTEFLTKIYYPNRINELNELIFNEFEFESNCSLWSIINNEEPRRLYINDDDKQAVGYIDLTNFNINTFNTSYPDKAPQILSFVIDFINSRPQHTNVVEWLKQGKEEKGLFDILEGKDYGDNFELIVGFENNIDNRILLLHKWVRKVIHPNFDYESIKKIRINSPDALNFIEELVKKYKAITGQNLDFDQICTQRDSQNNKPKNYTKDFFIELYNGIRTREDTEKAIFRLSTIGIIEDYFCDYNSNTFVLIGKKHTKQKYYDRLLNYLLQYFPKSRSEKKLKKIFTKSKDSSVSLEEFLLAAVEFLIDFTYKEIKNKRGLAIAEMKKACFEAAEHEDDPNWFKDYIDLYFNSKYARTDYSFVDLNDIEIDASLYRRYYNTDDSNESIKDKEDINTINEFINITRIDPKAGEIDNIKHLRGACIRMMTNFADSYVLKILNAYCLFMLEYKNKKYLDEAFENLSLGFQIMDQKEKLSESKLKLIFDEFVNDIIEHNTELQHYMNIYNLKFDFESLFVSRYIKQLERSTNLLRRLNNTLSYNG